MLIEAVKNITNKDEFKEKVLIYIRLVEVTAERVGLSVPIYESCNFDEILVELSEIGFVETKEDLALLKQTIGTINFDRLINSAAFVLAHQSLFVNVFDKLSNKRRREIQKSEAKLGKPKFVDFFAGAGGLSCGFTQAGLQVCFANDFEDVCVRTYRYNHPELPEDKVFKGDIRNIANRISDFVTEDVDVVVGGPPCQGFSSANQQRVIDDPRNELYKFFVQAVSQILPKFVVMENVKGMLKVAHQVVEDYESIKGEKDGHVYTYKVSYKLLNSVDFSVAQSRERLIYIAIRNDIQIEYNINPEDVFEQIRKNNEGNKHYLLRDALEAIKPLEAPRIKNMNEVDDEKTGKKIDVNHFVGNENPYLQLINDGRVIPYVFNHKARYLNDINYDIYRLLEQGNDASDPKIKGIMPYENRLHCFKDKYYKLIADKPSRTITAHLRMDCHSHIHPFQIRAITPREAARCQSFPDDYLFLGAYLKTYMQIGNAVPCLMAKGIANVIKKYL